MVKIIIIGAGAMGAAFAVPDECELFGLHAHQEPGGLLCQGMPFYASARPADGVVGSGQCTFDVVVVHHERAFRLLNSSHRLAYGEGYPRARSGDPAHVRRWIAKAPARVGCVRRVHVAQLA